MPYEGRGSFKRYKTINWKPAFYKREFVELEREKVCVVGLYERFRGGIDREQWPTG